MRRKIKGVLFDLDGVLYVGDKIVPGTHATLDYCRDNHIPFRFITNTSTRTVGDIADKLQRMGLEIMPDDIFSAVSASRDFLRQQDNPSVHLLIRDSAKSDFDEFVQDTQNPDFVIVGDIGAAWNYKLLNRVFRELMEGAELLAMHMNKYWQTEQGLQMDIGAFVVGLEFVSGKQAKVIGKPSQTFFKLAVESLDLSAEEVLVIGDDIENDIGGGHASGLAGVLVKTGKYREDIVKASDVIPDAIIDSIADLPEILESHR
ncbi:MAG: TIGR01458 family HAD-type hydrolase [Gammaproteobacteria bacterium]